MKTKLNLKSGFTLIELLVVMAIIGILIALSIFGLQGARTASRDARRKADLEQIRSGLEIYKADCNSYPSSSTFSLSSPTELKGPSTGPVGCAGNTYITQTPSDPISTQNYSYTSSDGLHYTLCAALENGGSAVSGCGSCGSTCNWKVTQP